MCGGLGVQIQGNELFAGGFFQPIQIGGGMDPQQLFMGCRSDGHRMPSTGNAGVGQGPPESLEPFGAFQVKDVFQVKGKTGIVHDKDRGLGIGGFSGDAHFARARGQVDEGRRFRNAGLMFQQQGPGPWLPDRVAGGTSGSVG